MKMNVELNLEAYKEIAPKFSEIHFSQFKNRIVRKISEEIEDVEGTIRNEHLWELGFRPSEKGEMNPHSANIEYLYSYLDKLRSFKSSIEDYEEAK